MLSDIFNEVKTILKIYLKYNLDETLNNEIVYM